MLPVDIYCSYQYYYHVYTNTLRTAVVATLVPLLSMLLILIRGTCCITQNQMWFVNTGKCVVPYYMSISMCYNQYHTLVYLIQDVPDTGAIQVWAHQQERPILSYP